LPVALHINEFLSLSGSHPIVDVRTPAEFAQGHIPGAHNIPLFTDEDRKIVGTIYKQEGKQPAILKGLELIGPRMHQFVSAAAALENSGQLLVHCWRGGMRSSSMAWLFETYGFKCNTLKGGYKSYRQQVLASFNEPKNIVVLGGKTGSGKTLILQELRQQGEQIIDLEKLANHKGSAFGALGEQKQISQEQFENELAFLFTQTDPQRKCWLEDESRKIGFNVLPDGLWEQMRNAKVFYVDLALPARIRFLVKEYGKFSKEELSSSINRIAKRLGGQHVKAAIEAIEAGDLETACKISLVYYDKNYNYGLSQRDQKNILVCAFEQLEVDKITKELIAQAAQL